MLVTKSSKLIFRTSFYTYLFLTVSLFILSIIFIVVDEIFWVYVLLAWVSMNLILFSIQFIIYLKNIRYFGLARENWVDIKESGEKIPRIHFSFWINRGVITKIQYDAFNLNDINKYAARMWEWLPLLTIIIATLFPCWFYFKLLGTANFYRYINDRSNRKSC